MNTATVFVSWFKDIGLQDRPTVGGKGGSLGELLSAGIDVPPGFVVRTEAFNAFVDELEKDQPIRSLISNLAADDLEMITEVTGGIRERIEKTDFPAWLDASIDRAYHQLCGDHAGMPVAVRSSATTEDADDASFAGLQDTFLWVLTSDSLKASIRSCWASLYSVESVSYRLKQQFPEAGVAMGVVIQQMVDARSAGVMFTRSPISGDRSVVAIEGAWGLGSSVVSGEVTPDRWVVSKLTGEITARDISDKHIEQAPSPNGGIVDVELPAERRVQPCLTDSELLNLKDIARRTEKHYGKPQDIEWAIEKQTGKFYLLQSRPETVWAAKDTAPIARPAADPKAHLMNIFSGGTRMTRSEKEG